MANKAAPSTGAPDLIVLHESDTVATALRNLASGSEARLSGPLGMMGTLRLRTPIALGHKAALVDIEKGAMIIKHGHPIGRATSPIRRGAHVHVHNVVSLSMEPISHDAPSGTDTDR